ncbi:hypothetical protein [Burkholderia multivorans]|nr:hypothetical protein [Burkholderia multivorans]MCO1400030.1 hypothetical protein [Burkholderia multivorans]
MIDDILGTDVAAVTLMEQARVETINSLTSPTAQPYILNRIGTQLGVQPGTVSNGSVDVVAVNSTPGFVFNKGFIISDGSKQYVLTTPTAVKPDGTASQAPHVHHLAWDHAHGVNDGGHAHGISQSPHGHGVNDGGHQHAYHVIARAATDEGSTALTGGGTNTSWDGQFDGITDVSGSNISIQPQYANVSINGSGANISIQNFHTEIDTWGANANITVGNTGNGTPVSVLNPYVALWKIIRVS